MAASVPYPPDPYAGDTRAPDAVTHDQDLAVPDSGARVAWWLALGASVFGVVIGAMMLAWPEATLKAVAVLFGIWLLLHGVTRIIQAITSGGAGAGERAIVGVVGVFFVVAGVVALRNQLASLALVITVIGLMWLIGGIMELVSAFGGPGGGYRTWHVTLGILTIIGGLIVLFWPDLTLVALVYLTGLWLIFMGLVQVALVLWVRRAVTA